VTVLERPSSLHLKVYHGVVGRTNIEIDDQLIDRAMRLYRLRSKREAVDLALRKLVGEPMGREEALANEGTGWGGDLAAIRAREEIPEP
jgi:Arc/MetJ family transcription regulator